MLARNHLVVNLSVAGAVLTVGGRVLAEDRPVGAEGVSGMLMLGVHGAAASVVVWLGAPGLALHDLTSPTTAATSLAWYAAALLLYLLGTLVPDLDNRSSLLGRWVGWLPLGPHRGLTHSLLLWVPLAVLLLGVLDLRLAVFYLAGHLLHLLVDGFSYSGWAPWWPLGRWKTHTLADGTALVVRNGGPRFYRVGRPSETGFLLLLVTPCWIAIAAAAVPNLMNGVQVPS